MGKVELKLEIDADLLAKARTQGMNLATILESVLRSSLPSQPDAEKARRWAEENVEALEAHRERIEAVGVFGDDLRTW